MAEKIKYLDSLRGIAALMVVLAHFASGFYPAITGNPGTSFRPGFEGLIYASPLNLLINGRFAVFIFFVLSGYILTYRFYASGDQAILNSSAVRRYFRLLPPILVSLLGTFVVLTAFMGFIQDLHWLTGIDYTERYFDQPADLGSMLRQAVWGSFFDSHVEYNAVLWTMGTEFLGSLLVFSLASLFGKARNRWVFYAGAGLFLFNTYYLSFILGMLLADLSSGQNRKAFEIGSPVVLLLVLGAGLLCGSYNDKIAYLQLFEPASLVPGLNPDLFFHSFGAFLVLLALLNSRTLQSLLSGRFLGFLGNISFSMYLMHWLVYGTFTTVLFLVLLSGLHLSYRLSLAIAFPLSILAVLAVSYLTFKYVDAPGIKLSRRVYEAFFAAGQKQAPWSLSVSAARGRITTFVRNKLPLLAILSVLLLVMAIGSTAFVKPAIDDYNEGRAAARAETGYLQYRDSTIAACSSLASYSSGGVNASTLGAFSEWAEGYGYLERGLSEDYAHMKAYGTAYQAYLNDGDAAAVAENLTYYGQVVSAADNQSRAYDEAYNAWYWQGRSPVFPSPAQTISQPV